MNDERSKAHRLTRILSQTHGPWVSALCAAAALFFGVWGVWAARQGEFRGAGCVFLLWAFWWAMIAVVRARSLQAAITTKPLVLARNDASAPEGLRQTLRAPFGMRFFFVLQWATMSACIGWILASEPREDVRDGLLGLPFYLFYVWVILSHRRLQVDVSPHGVRVGWQTWGLKGVIRHDAIRSVEAKDYDEWVKTQGTVSRALGWPMRFAFSPALVANIKAGLLITYERKRKTRTLFISMADPHAAVRILTGASER